MRALLVALLMVLGCRTQTPRTAAVAYRFRCDPPQARIIIDEEDRGPCVGWVSAPASTACAWSATRGSRRNKSSAPTVVATPSP